MNIVDIVVVFVFGLFILFGFFKGFLHALLSLAGTIVSLLVAFFFAQAFASFLGGAFGLNKLFSDLILSGLKNAGALFTTPIEATDAGQIAIALGQLGLPDFLTAPLSSAIAAAVPAGTSAIVLSEYLAPILANALLVMIAGTLLFIIIRVVLGLIQKLFKKLLKNHILKTVDRMLGAAFGAVKAYLVLSIIFMLATFLMPMEFFAPVRAILEQSTLGLFLYDNNILQQLLSNYIDFGTVTSTVTAAGETLRII
jgi:uncharacterized membrane protein required for colicin V production